MMSALKRGEGGSGKVDNSNDKLRDHVCDKGEGEGVQKSEIFMDVIDGSPLRKKSFRNSLCSLCRGTQTLPQKNSTGSIGNSQPNKTQEPKNMKHPADCHADWNHPRIHHIADFTMYMTISNLRDPDGFEWIVATMHLFSTTTLHYVLKVGLTIRIQTKLFSCRSRHPVLLRANPADPRLRHRRKKR